MAQATKTLMTAEAFAQLRDNGLRRELVNGEVIEVTPAGHDHSAIAARLAHLLLQAVLPEKLAEVTGEGGGFVLSSDPATVRAPDAALVLRERLPGGRRPSGFFPGAPDLAVEVVSPSDSANDIEAKVIDYLKAGAKLVWVVYPEERRVWVHRSLSETHVVEAGGALTGDPVLPGLSIPVADIFA